MCTLTVLRLQYCIRGFVFLGVTIKNNSLKFPQYSTRLLVPMTMFMQRLGTSTIESETAAKKKWKVCTQ